MSRLQSWSVWISPLAEKLARQLIVKFQIQAGFGLAVYLDVERHYDNHHAIRIWVQKLLNEGFDLSCDAVDSLGHQLVALLPS